MTDAFFDGYGTWYRQYSDVSGERKSYISVSYGRMVGAFRLSEDDEMAFQYTQSLDNCEWLYPSEHADDGFKKWIKTMSEFQWEMWCEENFSHPKSQDWESESLIYHFLEGYVFEIDKSKIYALKPYQLKTKKIDKAENDEEQQFIKILAKDKVIGLSGLLNAPSRQDDWFNVIDDMTRAFHDEHKKMPNVTQAWSQLWSQPPDGYNITTVKNKGEDCLKMISSNLLSLSAFKKRWGNYTKNKSDKGE